MLHCYLINYEMQATTSILGCPQCHIMQSSGKSNHSKLSTCAFLCYTTETL